MCICVLLLCAVQLYVLGRHCVLTRRNSITPAVLEAATAAAPAGRQGVLILPRLSADKLAAVAAAQQHGSSAQCRHPASGTADGSNVPTNGASHVPHKISSSGSSSSGTALADASVHGDPLAPPLWAMQQLAAYLRKALGMNLFNVDIIAPSNTLSSTSSCSACGTNSNTACGAASSTADGEHIVVPRHLQQQQHHQQQEQQDGQQQQQQQELLVVDINYFPGYDKVPGAELLFADFLAECAASAACVSRS